MQAQKRLVSLLGDNLSRFINLIPQRVRSPELTNSFKMYTFLLSSVLTRGEAIAGAEEAKEANAKTEKKKKGGDNSASIQHWNILREKIMSELLSMCKSDNLQVFWKSHKGKELRISVGEPIFKSTAVILESGMVVRSKPVKELSSKLIMHCIACFELQVEARMFFMQALMKGDAKNLPQALGEILSNYIAVDEVHGSAFAGMLIREIGKLEVADMGKDSSCSKSIATFLEVLGESCPGASLANISVLLPHLEMDSYIIRNGIVQLIGKLLLFLHRKVVEEHSQEIGDEEKGENRPKSSSGKTRNSLMDLLLDRVNDISSYTRCKVLQTLKELCEEQAIPVSFYSSVCEISVQRLEDKSSQVRKNTLQVLTSLLERNPFGPVLRLADFKHRLDNEAALNSRELRYCKEAIHFLECFDHSMELIVSQLSQGPAIVLECINLIKMSNQFRIQNSEKGLKKLLPLVVSMSKEQEVHDAVVEAYSEVFLPNGLNPKSSAQSLVKLNLSVSFSEKKCLARVIAHLVKNKAITKQVFQSLLEVCLKSSSDHVAEKASALEILSMIGQVNSSVILDCVESIMRDVFNDQNQESDVLVRAAFNMILSLDDISNVVINELKGHEFFIDKIGQTILGEIAQGPNWYGAAEQAINCLFRFCPQPEEIASNLLVSLGKRVGLIGDSQSRCSSRDLSHICFVVGHVAFRLLEQIDNVISDIMTD
jgi:condensin complex subunit 1